LPCCNYRCRWDWADEPSWEVLLGFRPSQNLQGPNVSGFVKAGKNRAELVFLAA